MLKRSEELRKLGKEYRDLFENMMDGIVLHRLIVDENGNPVDYILEKINNAAEKILSWKREDIEGKRATEVYSGDTPFIERYAKVAQTGKSEHFIDYYPRFGRWYEITSFCPERGYFANVFRDITERKQAEERIKHLNAVLYAIRAVNQLITWEKDREKLLQGACDKLIRTRGYHSVWIAIVDEKGRFVTATQAGFGKKFSRMIDDLKCGELPRCVRKALAQSGIVIVANPAVECGNCLLAGICADLTRAITCLKYEDRLYGFIVVTTPVKIGTNEEEQTLFGEVAGDIAFALHNIEIEEKHKQVRKELRESERKYKLIFNNTLNALFVLDAETMKIVLANQAALEMYGYNSMREVGKVSPLDFIPPEDRDRVRRVIVEGMFENDLQESHDWRTITKDGKEIWISARGKKTKYRGRLAGLISIRDITDRKQAEKELKQSFEKLQRILKETAHALAAAIEARDPYTAGHQRRVTKLAIAIAKKMGLSEKQINAIHMTALIHDIGKINAPSEILSKPTRLTKIEFEIIKTHPRVGYNILKEIEFPWPVAEIILQHHERMDGSGYPQGLSDDDIILEARILGVADVIEAMASHRPYRPAQGIDKALEEISQNRGVLYDPKVVDACLKLFTEKGFKFGEQIELQDEG